MKIKFTFFLLLITVQLLKAQFSYLNPVPNSQYQNPQTNIILKNGALIDRASVADKNLVEISGSVSGKHDWTARLSDDNKTVIIKPKTIFNYSETVTVTVHSVLRKADGAKVEGTTFSFKTRNEITAEERERYRQSDLETFIESFGYDPTPKNGQKITYPLDSMPTYQIKINHNPPGRVFYCNQQELDENDTNSFPTVIENDGTIVWAKDLGLDGHAFEINKTGYLTYYKYYPSTTWIVMDSNFNIIDSIQCGNGYELETNGHDLQMYPDGHSFLIAFNDQTVNMTQYGGVANADVKQIVIQELDANKDVVFEWKSFDHFQFTDAIPQVPLTNGQVDYCHTNSVERDVDGNLLISNRNFSELTKININTGDIMWRMGGENNQFTFVNDNIPEHYSEQHDFRRLPNGHITIFNNGNFLPVQRSSAKEYTIDEVNKVATLVWYYEHPDTGIHQVFGRASGNVQRLPNGNTMICWGTIFWDQGVPNMTEVDANKNIVWEMTFDQTGQKSYRSYRYNWYPCSRITGYTMKANVKPMKAILNWKAATGAKAYEVDYRKLGTTNWTVKSVNKVKAQIMGLTPSTSYEWRVKTLCPGNPPTFSAFSVLDTFTTLPLKFIDPVTTPESEISIYPVPASDHLVISMPDNEDATVFIRNILGVVVYSGKISADDNSMLNVDVQQWTKGIYLVEVKGDNTTTTRKIIVE